MPHFVETRTVRRDGTLVVHRVAARCEVHQEFLAELTFHKFELTMGVGLNNDFGERVAVVKITCPARAQLREGTFTL